MMLGLPFPVRPGGSRRARGLTGWRGMADGGLDPEWGPGHLAPEGEIEAGKEPLEQKGSRERPDQSRPDRRPEGAETLHHG
ncbi:hypothetical protein MTBSS4_130073 [Magnetospirillum sp. SS-4]|nr:hypothetical protein MTBSS4_130073 [Magnetospirillum sp. SS-4]